MTKITTFIFDLDGVITDTAEYHYLAWKKLADAKKMHFDKEMNELLKGVSRTDSLKIILKHNNVSIPDEMLEEWAAYKNVYYVELIKTVTPKDLFPGMIELFNELKERNIFIALGSASKNAEMVLNGLGITDYFDVIGDGHSVARSKPAPDLFLYVAEKLGVKPETCVVVEDAEAGVEAAKSAGMYAIGIGDPKTLGKADFIYPAPKEIILKDLIFR